MNHFLNITFALAALLPSAPSAKAQSLPPLPPSVIVNGSLLTGSNGSYSTANYPGSSGASLTITGSAMQGGMGAYFGANTGYWAPPYLISAGYWSPGYSTPGYSMPGYWAGGSYDPDTATWADQYWVPEQWVEGVWNDGYWVPDVWGPEYWVSTGAWNDWGTYVHFAFQMQNGSTIQPADSSGTPWATLPQFGIPAVLINGAIWPFNASDTAAAYDYFSGVAGDNYLWINAAYYGGYDPQLGEFSGTNSNGFFRDTSGSGVRVLPRNGGGSFLSIGSPVSGPPAIWSNGLTFRFLTTDLANGVDVYIEDDGANIFGGHIFVNSASGGVTAVSGLFTGSYTDPAFDGAPEATLPADYGGSPLPAGRTPNWGPPAIYVTGATWRYRGSTGMADYYGGERPGQVLAIAGNGAVSYSDRSLNFASVPGLYTGGVFQNLPVIVRGVTASGMAWTSRPTNASYPAAITVNGQPWYYSSTASNNSGYPTYLGSQSGQMLYLNGSTAVIADPTTSSYLTGTYLNGKFTFAGNTVDVKKANADGTPVDTSGPTTPGEIAGNLDVSGNHFTLGTWQNGAIDSNALTLSYSPPTETGTTTGLLKFDAIRPLTDWIWSNGPGSVERMRITSGGDVGIGTKDPKAKLDVAGVVHVLPGGDIPMLPPNN